MISSLLFCFVLFLSSPGPAVFWNIYFADGFENFHQLDLPGVVGPESIAFDCNGQGPYVGVSDGRILKWQRNGWQEFAFTAINRQRSICDGSTNTNLEPACGRPLGIKFNPKTCDLYIADAYFGLMVVGPKGGQAQQLVNSAEGVPFRFTNALDIDSTTGIVYFTDSSTVFQRRQYLFAVLEGDKTGRLLKYNPHNKEVSVMYRELAFPNGVALSKDNTFLLVAESSTMQILKFSLQGTKACTPQVIAQLSRFPDNIKLTKGGEYWVALNTGRKIQEHQDNSLIPETMVPWYANDPVGVKIDAQGNILRVLYGNGGTALESLSEIEEHGGSFYMGSSVKPYVGVMKI